MIMKFVIDKVKYYILNNTCYTLLLCAIFIIQFTNLMNAVDLIDNKNVNKKNKKLEYLSSKKKVNKFQTSYEDVKKFVINEDVVNLQRFLTFKPESINNKYNDYNDTLLMLATKNESIIVVKLLLSKGANPSITDIGLATPLHIAARKCNYEIAKTLINNKKININAKDIEQYTPLMRAKDFQCQPIIDLLSSYENGTFNEENNSTISLIQGDMRTNANLKKTLNNISKKIQNKNDKQFKKSNNKKTKLNDRQDKCKLPGIKSENEKPVKNHNSFIE